MSPPKASEPAHSRPAAASTKKLRALQMGVRIGTDGTTDDLVRVEIELEGRLATSNVLRFEPLHDARIERLVIRDEQGELPTREEQNGRFTLDRQAAGTLVVRYEVRFGEGNMSAVRPSAEPVELRALGSDLLLLPETEPEQRVPVTIRLETGVSGSGGATSFALGKEQSTKVRLFDLRRALFLTGDLGSATFHSVDGDDIAAWLGVTTFDPRWVSAELAGVRASVDSWVGRSLSPSSPPFSLLYVVNRRSEPPIIVRHAPGGLILAVDRRAPWTPTALLLATQALTQRYIGGFLRVVDGETAEDFFTEGFSRAIARDVLVGMSLFGHAERASEMNALLSTFTFASEPGPLATARGALVATALDVALQRRPGERGSLRAFLRERLAQAANDRRETISRADFIARIGASTNDATAKKLADALERGAEIELPADLLGPCYRLVKKQLVAFELGFVTSAGEQLTVESVKRGSRADAAGVRVGDVITDVRYEQGKSYVPVDATITRDGKPMRVRFLPWGSSKPGRVFERVPGVPDERCNNGPP